MKKLLVVVLTLLSHSLFAGNYELDISHTNVGFKIKHLVVSSVNGRFNKFTGTFKFDEKKRELSDVKASIEVNSIDTNDSDRDKHLRSPDFFDVEKFKTMEFVSTKITKKGKETFQVAGDLMIHGIKKTVVLNVEVMGPVTDPWKNQKLAFSAKTKIKRKDFNMTWNKALDQGGVMLDEIVKIEIEGEANAE